MPSDRPVKMLVVEDDRALAEILCEELAARGYEVEHADTVSAALALVEGGDFDVGLLDLTLPDGSGIDVLKRIAETALPMEVIVLTGNADVSTAIEAMKLGAYDYLTKPARVEELEVRVAKAAEKARLRRENWALGERLRRQTLVEGILTEDPAMKAVLDTMAQVAASDLSVLIVGESGTGKELVARGVHRLSPRAAHPFMAVSCAALPETLLESELFGHERGAFTGALERKPGLIELADRGVLFLDEIGEAPLSVQVKLLRVLEMREVLRVGGTRPVRCDVRIVSATSREIKEEMEAGRFRRDLYYRLNGVTLALPPLRERGDDVALLARHFANRFAPGKTLSPRTLAALRGYTWPGNVRELGMAIQRAAVLTKESVIEPADLPLDVTGGGRTSFLGAKLTLAELEREYIATVLVQNSGNRGKTARDLGINSKTLYNKLRQPKPEPDEG